MPILKEAEQARVIASRPPGTTPGQALAALKARGFDLEGFDSPQQDNSRVSPEQFRQQGFFQKIATTARGQDPYSGQKPIDPTFDNPLFEAVGRGGKALAGKINELSGTAAENFGTPGVIAGGIASTYADLLLPQEKQGAGVSFIAGLNTAGKIAEGFKQLAGKAGRTRVVQPTQGQKSLGDATAAFTSTRPGSARALIADPSIMDDVTPNKVQVSAEYKKAFEQAGKKINSEVYNEVTGSRFPPNERQKARLEKIVTNALDKIQDPGKFGALADEEAFIARSAAAKLKDHTEFLKNSKFRDVVNGAQSQFDDVLENSSLPNIRDLSAKWFRASVKEEFSNLLPRNRSGGVNALRAFIMGKLAVNFARNLLDPSKRAEAIGDAVSGVVMSPLLVGKLIVTLSNSANPTVAQPLIRGLLAAYPGARLAPEAVRGFQEANKTRNDKRINQ